MRDQYAGDLSDFLKFALLRGLAGEGRRLGVAWYFLPGHDGRRDGQHREYCLDPRWPALDEPLHAALAGLREHSVAALEGLPIWPAGTRFHRAPVPSSRSRAPWAAGVRQSLEGCDLVFLDPDNGLGRRSKHATLDEVRGLRQPGRALVLIKFPGRTPHAEQVLNHHARLCAEAGAGSVITVQTSVMVRTSSDHWVPRQRWFTVLDGDAALHRRAEDYARRINGLPRARARLS